MCSVGRIRPKNSPVTIAAHTLLSHVSNSFSPDVISKGTTDKLNTVSLSDSEDIPSLLAVLDIANVTSGQLHFRSTLALELATRGSVEAPNSPPVNHYPSQGNLSVRLFFRIGTMVTLAQLPIFGSKNPESLTSFLDLTGQEAISDPVDWCSECQSTALIRFPFPVSQQLHRIAQQVF